MSDSGREWRKVYRSITSSDRLASVSDGAAWLYTLLLVSQDDEGRYPWTKAMVRTLTATRPDWSFDNTSDLLHELVDVELASIEDGLVILRRGSELNGIPRYSHDREPHQYPAPAVLRQAAAVGAAEAPLEVQQGSHGLKRKEGEESSPPTGAHRARENGVRPAWEPPDWFLPLTTLPGYKAGNHTAAAKRIAESCAEANADTAEVVAHFASQFRTLRHSFAWNDPVATLKGKPLMIAIQEVQRGSHGNAQGNAQGRRASTDSWRGLPFADERAD